MIGFKIENGEVKGVEIICGDIMVFKIGVVVVG